MRNINSKMYQQLCNKLCDKTSKKTKLISSKKLWDIIRKHACNDVVDKIRNQLWNQVSRQVKNRINNGINL